MADFKTQVESMIGTLNSYWTDNTNANINQSLADGCKDVIRRVSSSNPEDIWLFTESTSVTTAGASVSSAKIYDVSRGSKPCKFVPVTKRHRAADVGSIEYATSEFPVYYLLNGKVFVLPQPGAGTDLSITAFTTNDSGFKTQITTGTEHGFAAGDQVVISQADTTLNNTYYAGSFYVYQIIDTTNFVIHRNYSAAAVTGYTVSEPTAVVQHLSYPSVDSSQSSIDNFPESYYPLVSTYGAMAVLMRTMSDVHNRTPELVLPVAPIAPDVLTVSDTVPTFTPPADFITPVPPNIEDIGDIGLTLYSSFPTIEDVVIPSLSFPIENISIGALNLSLELPVPPQSPSFDRGALDFTTIIRGLAPKYVKPVFSPPTFPTIPNIVLPEAPVAPNIGTIPSGTANQAGSNLADYTVPVLNAPDFTSLDVSIADEDVEVAGIKLSKIQAQIGQYQAEMQNALNVFNKESKEYDSRLQEAMTNAKAELDSNNQGLQAELAIYNADIGKYTSDVQNVISKWERENLQVLYTKWVTEYSNRLQEYQHDISNALNQFNEQSAEYQAEVSKATADASNKMSSETSEFQGNMSIYQQELAAYQAKTAHMVTEWQSRIVQVSMTEFTQKRAEAIQEWSTRTSSLIQQYGNNVTYSQQKFTSELNAWQAKAGDILQRFQAKTGADTQIYVQELSAENQRYQADLNKADTQFRNALENYKADVELIRAKNQENLAKHNAESQIWTASAGNSINVFNAKLAELGQEYQWYQDKMSMLRSQYESGFIMSPEAQKQQREGAR
tara:strand:+ start:1333 stop:3684 length:2352 start_codon:yes stop_codon:yes gene_type:complete